MKHTITLSAFLVCTFVQAAAFAIQWDGWGVTGGNFTSTGGDWNDPTNWDSSSVPTASDDVDITFDTSDPYSGGAYPDGSTFFELVPNGAVGKNVTITNQQLLAGGNSRLRFEPGATVNFETFHVQSSINRALDFRGATLVLSGGGAGNPSFRHVQTNTLGWTGTGPTLQFTGPTVVLDQRGGAAATSWQFLNSASTIDASGFSLTGGGFQFHPTQVISNLPEIVFTTDIENLGTPGTRLDNLSSVGLSNTGGAPTIAAGTYAYLDSTRNTGLSSNLRPKLGGDVTLAGSKSFGGSDYALVVRREGRSGGANQETILSLDDHTLTLTGPNANALIGRLDYDPSVLSGSPQVNFAVLDVNGSAASAEIEGDLQLGPSGVLRGNGTVKLQGNFENQSQRGDQYDTTAMELQMVGSGTEAFPQTLELHGVDLGANLTGFAADNFALDSLVVGSPTEMTFVKLVDLFDNGPVVTSPYNSPDGEPDALYVNSLFVNAGSTLDLNGLNLYVGGVLVPGGSMDFGPGLILPLPPPVPEPSTLMLLGLGATIVFRKTRRRKKCAAS